MDSVPDPEEISPWAACFALLITRKLVLLQLQLQLQLKGSLLPLTRNRGLAGSHLAEARWTGLHSCHLGYQCSALRRRLARVPSLRRGGVVVALALVLLLARTIVASANFLTEQDILAALPLRRWSWHRCLVLVGPPVVFVILAVWYFQLRLPQLSLPPCQICRSWQGIASSIVVDASRARLALWR